MRTFSISEQSITEPESGHTFDFGVDETDTAQVTLKLTHKDHEAITLRFRRNGSLVSMDYDVPDTEEDVELRHKLAEANANVSDAQSHHVMANGQSRPKDERDTAKAEYDAALKQQAEAQAAIDKREAVKRAEKRKRAGLPPEGEPEAIPPTAKKPSALEQIFPVPPPVTSYNQPPVVHEPQPVPKPTI